MEQPSLPNTDPEKRETKKPAKKKPPTPQELISHYQSKGLEPQEASVKVIEDLQNVLFRVISATNKNKKDKLVSETLKKKQMMNNQTLCPAKEQAPIIPNNNDMMIDILLRLPLKCLLQSKCVCKWWNHLIRDPLFISSYSRRNPQHQISGFFLQKFLFLELYSRLEFIRFEGEVDASPQPSLSFIQDDKGVCIQSSCNGLLLCSSFRCHEEDRKYYICKPTTKQYQLLPELNCKTVFAIDIAYDPRLSPHYKIICICNSNQLVNHWQIKIYDAATSSWRVSGNPVIISHDLLTLHSRGVFWKGALHWVGTRNSLLRFEIQREHVVKIPMPAMPDRRSERKIGYFGESGGHLYLIEINRAPTIVFNVIEMRSNLSGWSVKYQVDLRRVALSYPSMIRENVQDIHRYMFSILHIFNKQREDEDGSYMVLHIPGNFIKYMLKDGNFMQLVDNGSLTNQVDKSLGLWYSWEGTYPFSNPLCFI
ncbi:F-box and associated interaction domains-containing protein [Euphorbia peplus]|nr:F-box and associated interaction domains-containing protein [Euphorbia peplus]